MKRFMGRKMDEPEVQAEMKRVPGVTFCEVDGLVGVEVMYDGEPKKLSMAQCAAMMIFKMSQICAESNKGAAIAETVVSVPAWFTNAQRLCMLDACDVAGVRCLRLMHDTTATALEYGIWRSAKKAFDEKDAQRVLFVDLGYSSYQVSVVDYVIGKLTVKATAFDRTLGGRDFDLAIAEWIGAEFQAKHKCDPMSNVKARMKKMLQTLGGDSALGGAAGAIGDDDDALDQIFERMQDPAVLERLQDMAKNESFQQRVQQMTQDPKFMAAAGEYAQDMAEEVMEAESQPGDDDDFGLAIEDEDEEEEA